MGKQHRGRLYTVPIPQHLSSVSNQHTSKWGICIPYLPVSFSHQEIMPQALSIYQKTPSAVARGTRLELVALYDLGLTFPHHLVTHRFYFLSASIVSTLVAPCDDDQTPIRPGPRQNRRHAVRKRAREERRQLARREQELSICAKGIPNTPQGALKISAFMNTVGEFYFVVRLHKYPTVWHLGDFEASEVIATVQTESIEVRYFSSAVNFGLGLAGNLIG